MPAPIPFSLPEPVTMAILLARERESVRDILSEITWYGGKGGDIDDGFDLDWEVLVMLSGLVGVGDDEDGEVLPLYLMIAGLSPPVAPSSGKALEMLPWQ